MHALFSASFSWCRANAPVSLGKEDKFLKAFTDPAASRKFMGFIKSLDWNLKEANPNAHKFALCQDERACETENLLLCYSN